MKIAVATDDGVDVALHTGRCRGFAIYEIKGSAAARIDARPNGHTAHAQGLCQGDHKHEAGEGHHSHVALVDALADCAALITRGLGPRLVADLAARGIEVYICPEQSADEAAKFYAQGLLLKAQPGSHCCCHRE